MAHGPRPRPVAMGLSCGGDGATSVNPDVDTNALREQNVLQGEALHSAPFKAIDAYSFQTWKMLQ